MPSGMPTMKATISAERELERGRAVPGEQFGHRLVVGERRAEVAGEHLAQVFEVLLPTSGRL